MPKERYVSGAYHNQSGSRTYKTEEEMNPCPYMSTFEEHRPYVENMNYDLTRLSRDWTKDQVHPKFLSPQLKSWRRLRYPDRPSYPQTMYPRSTINNCGEFAYVPGCPFGSPEVMIMAMEMDTSMTKESLQNKPDPAHEESVNNALTDEYALGIRTRRYELPGLAYDPPGYDDYSLNLC